MCYNCGCHNKQDDMGDSNNITEQTFQNAAKAWGQTIVEAKKNVYSMLQDDLRRELQDSVQAQENKPAK